MRPPPVEHCAFPTHVGVILEQEIELESTINFPHTCGGDPWSKMDGKVTIELSPHMWG